jgi:hypothetical protein
MKIPQKQEMASTFKLACESLERASANLGIAYERLDHTVERLGHTREQIIMPIDESLIEEMTREFFNGQYPYVESSSPT